jgi:hypothetical protein
MFSHSPGALHPFCRQRSVALDREFASRLDDDLDAGWNLAGNGLVSKIAISDDSVDFSAC